jgi:hypothetical protein
MGMSLPHGGHLSHGAAVNHSGVIWKAVHYGVDPSTGRIDHDVVREQARRERPRLIIAGGSAYARIIDFAAFRATRRRSGSGARPCWRCTTCRSSRTRSGFRPAKGSGAASSRVRRPAGRRS